MSVKIQPTKEVNRMNTPVKPPIGVLPRKFFEEFLADDIVENGGMCLRQVYEERLAALSGAITRYSEAKLHIDAEWIKEYNYTLALISIEKNIFKLYRK
jgi:hypothetical protein